MLFPIFFWLFGIFTRYCVADSDSNNHRFNVMFNIQAKAVFSALTHILHRINPLLIFSLDTCNLTISLLGCSYLFIVMTFLVFLFISSSLLFVHFKIPVTYLIKNTVHVYIAMILLLPLNPLFIINFVLLKYSLRIFSFTLLSLILLYC